MATVSFTNRVSLTKKDAEKLSSILSSKKMIKNVIEVFNHKEVKGTAISNFLGIK